MSLRISLHRVTELLEHWSYGTDAAMAGIDPAGCEDLRWLRLIVIWAENDPTKRIWCWLNEAYLAPGRPNQWKLADPCPIPRSGRPSDAPNPG